MGPEGDSRFGDLWFSFHNNENQICSKWSTIKWETFIKKKKI